MLSTRNNRLRVWLGGEGVDLHACKFRKAVCWIGIGTALIGGNMLEAQSSSQASKQESQIIDDFGARVTRYLELRTREAGTPPKPTKSTDKLENKEQEMRTKVQAARANAKQGDIFSPEIAEYFRRQIAATLHGPQGERIRASLHHAEPVHNLPLAVNQAYPEGVPLQSTPPSLLLNLPRLPKELEYRIVGRDLVLHDTAANLVVDFVPNAVPTP